MNHSALAYTAVMLAAASPAIAKDKVDPRVDAALACSSIAESEARLACYDRTVPALREAVAAGHLISAEEATTPIALEGTVVAAAVSGFNRYNVRMDSGDRWQVIVDGKSDEPPRLGAKIRLRKAPLGNYWFEEPKMPDRRAKYLGRSSS